MDTAKRMKALTESTQFDCFLSESILLLQKYQFLEYHPVALLRGVVKRWLWKRSFTSAPVPIGWAEVEANYRGEKSTPPFV